MPGYGSRHRVSSSPGRAAPMILQGGSAGSTGALPHTALREEDRDLGAAAGAPPRRASGEPRGNQRSRARALRRRGSRHASGFTRLPDRRPRLETYSSALASACARRRISAALRPTRSRGNRTHHASSISSSSRDAGYRRPERTRAAHHWAGPAETAARARSRTSFAVRASEARISREMPLSDPDAATSIPGTASGHCVIPGFA